MRKRGAVARLRNLLKSTINESHSGVGSSLVLVYFQGQCRCDWDGRRMGIAFKVETHNHPRLLERTAEPNGLAA